MRNGNSSAVRVYGQHAHRTVTFVQEEDLIDLSDSSGQPDWRITDAVYADWRRLALGPESTFSNMSELGSVMLAVVEGSRLTPVTTAPRYHIVEIIGRGGMGHVCLADDVMLDRKVALKFVTEPDETDGLDQLLSEARAAAALDHPFICSIYEVTTLNGRPCIAMEYVRGESLERRLRGGPLRLGEALRVAEEIAEAVDAAHKRRVVHRDLKPANVMLTEDGHIKVMDFGLATRLPHTDAVDQMVTVAMPSHEVRGTPAYMAPEQIRGAPADRRSDIFAFGILLYELVSGTHPFKRPDIESTFAAILREPAATLHDRLPSIPPTVDALLARLLAKDPAARHQSFGDVRSVLRRLSVDLSPSATFAAAIVDRPTTDGSARLIGRDAERAQVLRGLHDAKSGRGSLILLFGDAGVGKSRLAEDALGAARQLGCHTLSGRCYEQQGTPALIPFIEVLDEASRLMPAAVFRQAIKASAPELATLMPELHRLFPDMPPPMELPPQLRQRFLFTNIREFLTRAAQFAPLVIFIDDLQWADESTIQLTQHLAQQLANLPMVLLAACREGESGVAPAVTPPQKAHFTVSSTASAVRRVRYSGLRPSRRRSITSSASGSLTRSCCARLRRPTCSGCWRRSASRTLRPDSHECSPITPVAIRSSLPSCFAI